MPNEVLSRFLTTAMLPKLAALSDRRRLVVLLATNHLENFDIAISRPGRFDVIVPVNPPTWQEKTRHWPEVGEKLISFGADLELVRYSHVATQLSDLTYGEFENVSGDLAESADLAQFQQRLKAAHDTCTLKQTDDSGKSWKDRVADQGPKIRLPRRLLG
jgi:SpoVK/Ycf46/Vps4 family AAA+-type ATPase